MRCRCKKSFVLVGYNFRLGEYYDYYTSVHEETSDRIYFVETENNTLPMMETKFQIFFDNIQYIREERLNKILDEK